MNYFVNEMFTSIDGEVNEFGQGRPSFFIRMQGCNQKCSYCDTEKSQKIYYHDKDVQTFEDISCEKSLDFVIRHFLASDCNKVTITGGEPLLQNIEPLVNKLISLNTQISVETNGTVECWDLWPADMHVSMIVDVKLPSSGVEQGDIKFNWIQAVARFEETRIKFVVSDEHDFNIASQYIEEYELPIKQCCFGIVSTLKDVNSLTIGSYHMSHNKLLDMMLMKGYRESLINVQLHKFINLK